MREEHGGTLTKPGRNGDIGVMAYAVALNLFPRLAYET